jgi:hypothetical protein
MSIQLSKAIILSPFHHPSERAALKAKLLALEAQVPTKARIVQGQLYGTFAVEYPNGIVEPCHNIATARTLCNRFNQPLS